MRDSLQEGLPKTTDLNWHRVRLTDIFEISSGLSKPREEFGHGSPFLTFKDVLDNFFVPDQLGSLVNSSKKEQVACSIKRGDVFLTRTSETYEDLGMSAVAVRDYPNASFNGFTKRLRPKYPDLVVPEYAAYYLRGRYFRQDVTAMSTLSTRASLNNEMISRLTIVLPPITVQEQIGSILKSLDDKIELNRRMNATLDSMAQAIFKSWFIDFDPVKINAGQMIPSFASFAAYDTKILDLFPSTFQVSELGPIPVGWTINTLNDLGEVNRGRSRHRPRHAEHLYGGPYPFVQTGDIKASAGRITKFVLTYSEAGLAQSRLWPEGTMCITIAANIAETAILTFPACFPDSVIGFIPDESKCRVYVAEYTFRHLKERLQREATGSVQDNINLETIRRTYFVCPPRRLQDVFYEIFEPLNSQIIKNERESLTLAAQRDALLPKMLQGEI